MAGVAAPVVLALATLPAVRLYWRVHSANPVRNGIQLAEKLGCFSCHGPKGASGIPDPGLDDTVPQWSGGVWMMYVDGPDEIRQFILDGTSAARAESTSVQREREKAAIQMPAYRDLVSTQEVEELTAAFLLLSGMARPPEGTVADQGHELARRWECFACHGVGGSGGLPNPGSFSGFIPGWYGGDYEDLVRNREEFDSWVLEGKTPRLAENRVARFFVERQRLQMPAYRDMSAAELDALWAYVRWLGETEGGLTSESSAAKAVDR